MQHFSCNWDKRGRIKGASTLFYPEIVKGTGLLSTLSPDWPFLQDEEIIGDGPRLMLCNKINCGLSTKPLPVCFVVLKGSVTTETNS